MKKKEFSPLLVVLSASKLLLSTFHFILNYFVWIDKKNRCGESTVKNKYRMEIDYAGDFFPFLSQWSFLLKCIPLFCVLFHFFFVPHYSSHAVRFSWFVQFSFMYTVVVMHKKDPLKLISLKKFRKQHVKRAKQTDRLLFGFVCLPFIFSQHDDVDVNGSC